MSSVFSFLADDIAAFGYIRNDSIHEDLLIESSDSEVPNQSLFGSQSFRLCVTIPHDDLDPVLLLRTAGTLVSNRIRQSLSW